MGLGQYRNSFIRELSTGTRRVVDLACQVAHRPTVILLDEPSSGIAQREVEALAPVLLRLRDEMGASLIVIEHDMPLITNVSDRMIALEEALQEVRRMSDLVESLLTLARADEGRFDLHREPVELAPLVQEVYETALILGEAQGVTVNLPFTADVVVMGDRTRLRQLFLNLVTNAIKYTPDGGAIEIRLEPGVAVVVGPNASASLCANRLAISRSCWSPRGLSAWQKPMKSQAISRVP